MTRNMFIEMYDSAFYDLVTEYWAEEYNQGYTAGLLRMGLCSGLIDISEWRFLTNVRGVVKW